MRINTVFSKKAAALLLVLCLMLPAICACGSKPQKTQNVTDSLNTVDEQIGAVPADVDFGGEKFTILCRDNNAWSNCKDELVADEDSSDIVNQAIYQRNLDVEEALGVTLDVIPIPGHWTDADTFTNTFRNSVLAGAGAYDAIAGQMGFMNELALFDLYSNVYDIPYLKDDLTSDYFYQDIRNELTVNGMLFFLIGDYTLTYLDELNVLYFNKQMAEDNNVEDLYQLVRDGDWTFEKMAEITRGMYRDYNGNSVHDVGDIFGYITDYENTADALYSQFDAQSTRRDESGAIVIDPDQGKIVNILERLIDFYNTEDVYAYKTYGGMLPEDRPFSDIFTSGRALFYPEVLAVAKKYRGMQTDFGILPFPKWDSRQEKYLTQAQAGYSVIVVPIDCTDYEKAGAVLDAMFAKSRDLVIPAYYDVALKDKYARDEESGEMLDIIRDGVCINFGFFYPLGVSQWFRTLLYMENHNFVSYFAANQRVYERNLQKVMRAFERDDEE